MKKPASQLTKDITFAELENVMRLLKFQKSVSRTKDQFREEILGRQINVITFSNPEFNINYRLVERQDEAVVPKYELAKIAHQLFWRGIIESKEDLAKMIEKERLHQRQEAVQTAA